MLIKYSFVVSFHLGLAIFNLRRLFVLSTPKLDFAQAPLPFVMAPLNIIIAEYHFPGCLLELIYVAVSLDIAPSPNFCQFFNSNRVTFHPALF
jgi:hypothetical protein